MNIKIEPKHDRCHYSLVSECKDDDNDDCAGPWLGEGCVHTEAAPAHAKVGPAQTPGYRRRHQAEHCIEAYL